MTTTSGGGGAVMGAVLLQAIEASTSTIPKAVAAGRRIRRGVSQFTRDLMGLSIMLKCRAMGDNPK